MDEAWIGGGQIVIFGAGPEFVVHVLVASLLCNLQFTQK
jgi:hypothetical protein